MVSVQATPHEAMPERKGIQCVIVLDCSASMADMHKLELCKRTIAFLCKEILSEQDSLGLVVFDSEPKVVFPCEPMNYVNKSKLLTELNKVKPGDHTNLSGGLFQGLDCLRNLPCSEETVSAVLLLSDGEATSGITDRAKLVRMANNVVESFGGGKPILHAFGYGATFDPVLEQLATITQGTFYHVANVEDVPLAFSDSMGGCWGVVHRIFK